ncbi:unnamed protein product, partial [Ilex paraguariensis]
KPTIWELSVNIRKLLLPPAFDSYRENTTSPPDNKRKTNWTLYAKMGNMESSEEEFGLPNNLLLLALRDGFCQRIHPTEIPIKKIYQLFF